MLQRLVRGNFFLFFSHDEERVGGRRGFAKRLMESHLHEEEEVRELLGRGWTMEGWWHLRFFLCWACRGAMRF